MHLLNGDCQQLERDSFAQLEPLFTPCKVNYLSSSIPTFNLSWKDIESTSKYQLLLILSIRNGSSVSFPNFSITIIFYPVNANYLLCNHFSTGHWTIGRNPCPRRRIRLRWEGRICFACRKQLGKKCPWNNEQAFNNYCSLIILNWCCLTDMKIVNEKTTGWTVLEMNLLNQEQASKSLSN